VNKQMLASETSLFAEAFDTSTFRGGGRLLFGGFAARARLLPSRQNSSRPELLRRRRCQMFS